MYKISRNSGPSFGIPSNIRLRSVFAGIVLVPTVAVTAVGINYGVYKGVEKVYGTMKSLGSQPSQPKPSAPTLVSQ